MHLLNTKIFFLLSLFSINILCPMESRDNTNKNINLEYLFTKGNSELYGYFDTSNLPIAGNNNTSFTYFIPGLVEQNVSSKLETIVQAKHNMHLFPGSTMAANGVVHRKNGIQYAFNITLEASRQLQILKHLVDSNCPVELLHTICYGFFTTAATLHALYSNNSEAIELRYEYFSSSSEASYVRDKIKCIIAINPLISTAKTVKVGINPYIDKIITVSTTAPLVCDITQTAFDYNMSLNPISIVLPFLGFIFKNKITSLISWQGLRYRTSIDKQRGDCLQLLYDFREKEKKTINTPLCVAWQKEDDVTDTLYVNEIACLKNVFSSFYGIGSPFKKHQKADQRQREFINYIRYINNMPHYSNPNLLNKGKGIYNNLLPYHINEDWEGLKEYTEDPSQYLL